MSGQLLYEQYAMAAFGHAPGKETACGGGADDDDIILSPKIPLIQPILHFKYIIPVCIAQKTWHGSIYHLRRRNMIIFPALIGNTMDYDWWIRRGRETL